ncbi:DUF2267 domain-containing protein [Ornithinicoccus halotolerans]|uniref:DUF2267 domain-containing protein n=1 Tax=Ornithinicoccus halotolerans TaxID=1748220 RepID=UPI0012964E28|nr:DUF2267 domain-containing protein [Ornithinicoccus halotolerans]
MRHDEFLATVRERGQYADRVEVERVTGAVLGLLGARLTPGEAEDLAAQLPEGTEDAVLAGPGSQGGLGVEEFVATLAQRLESTRETARWDASAVLSTVADSVTGGQLNQVLGQLQIGYAELFGKPDLA